MDVVFFNKNGQPIAYTEDGIHIYLYSGEPVAYFDNDSVYSFSGRHLGWFIKGWVRDNNGNCIFFTEDAEGGPVKPVKWIKPVRSVKHIKPVKGVKEVKPVHPVKSLSWSPLSSEMFFRQ